jgi:predicted ArsR family transcriptional regulator
MADAGFEPRFRRRSAKAVEITFRECPFGDLLDEHRELVCAVHRGLLEGMLAASRPVMRMTEFEERSERGGTCGMVARGT